MAIIIECDNCKKQVRLSTTTDHRGQMYFNLAKWSRPPVFVQGYSSAGCSVDALCQDCSDAGEKGRADAIAARKPKDVTP